MRKKTRILLEATDELLMEIHNDVQELREKDIHNDCSFSSIYDVLSTLSNEVALNRLQSMYDRWGLIILNSEEELFMFPFDKPNTDLDRRKIAEKGYIYHSTIANREFWCKPNE